MAASNEASSAEKLRLRPTKKVRPGMVPIGTSPERESSHVSAVRGFALGGLSHPQLDQTIDHQRRLRDMSVAADLQRWGKVRTLRHHSREALCAKMGERSWQRSARRQGVFPQTNPTHELDDELQRTSSAIEAHEPSDTSPDMGHAWDISLVERIGHDPCRSTVLVGARRPTRPMLPAT